MRGCNDDLELFDHDPAVDFGIVDHEHPDPREFPDGHRGRGLRTIRLERQLDPEP